MNKVAFSLGSNSDDCHSQMKRCINWLKEHLRDVTVSLIYETPAVNGKDGNYLNAVAVGYTEEAYETLFCEMKDYEVKCGRTPESKRNGSIPIDIDIVVWNDCVLREKDYNRSYFQIGWNEIKY